MAVVLRGGPGLEATMKSSLLPLLLVSLPTSFVPPFCPLPIYPTASFILPCQAQGAPQKELRVLAWRTGEHDILSFTHLIIHLHMDLLPFSHTFPCSFPFHYSLPHSVDAY